METIKYRPDIDGLRALAVTLVILFHVFGKIFTGGFIGVDVFFVISGFLITSNLIRDLETNSFSFIEFYARRFRRIVPPLMLILLFVFAVSYFLMPGIDFKRLGSHLVAGATFTSNILLAREAGYFDLSGELKPFLHLWSLGIEEQFYIIWPLLLFVAFRVFSRFGVGRIILILLASSFFLNILKINSHPISTFYFLPTRFWELLMGAGVAWLHGTSAVNNYWSKKVTSLRNRSLLASVVGLSLILSGGLFLKKTLPFPGYWALLPTLGATLIILSGPEGWINNKFFSKRPLVFIGLISYPLYLWHWVLLSLVKVCFVPNPASLMLFVIIFVSFVFSFLTYKYLEIPIRKNLKFDNSRFYRRPLVVVSATVALIIGVSALGFEIKNGNLISYDRQKNPLAYELQLYSTYDISETRIGQCFIDTSLPFRNYDPICYFQDLNLSEKSVVLIGDSHAAHLYQGLKGVAAELNLNMMQLNASSCPPLLGEDEKYSLNCRLLNNFTFKKLEEVRPSVVILSAEWQSYIGEPDFVNRFDATVKKVREMGNPLIIVVGPLPRWNIELPKILEKNFLRLGRPIPMHTDSELDKSFFQVNQLMGRVARDAGTQYFSLTEYLCNDHGCTTMVGRSLSTDVITYDRGHLTKAGARFVSEPIKAKLRAAILR